MELINSSDIRYVLRNANLFSSDIGISGSTEPVIPRGIHPPLHSEYRRLIDQAFSPRRMAELAPKVAHRVSALIDQFADKGDCNFSQAISVPTAPKIYEFIYGVIADRRDKPGKDVITRLLQARIENDRTLSDNEIARIVFLLISAGWIRSRSRYSASSTTLQPTPQRARWWSPSQTLPTTSSTNPAGRLG